MSKGVGHPSIHPRWVNGCVSGCVCVGGWVSGRVGECH